MCKGLYSVASLRIAEKVANNTCRYMFASSNTDWYSVAKPQFVRGFFQGFRAAIDFGLLDFHVYYEDGPADVGVLVGNFFGYCRLVKDIRHARKWGICSQQFHNDPQIRSRMADGWWIEPILKVHMKDKSTRELLHEEREKNPRRYQRNETRRRKKIAEAMGAGT